MPGARVYYAAREAKPQVFGFPRRIDAETWVAVQSGTCRPKISKVNDKPLVYRTRSGGPAAMQVWYLTPSRGWLAARGWDSTNVEFVRSNPDRLKD